MLDVKPILTLDRDGRVVPLDRVRGRENLVPRVLALLEQRLAPPTPFTSSNSFPTISPMPGLSSLTRS